jgi:hypothetical protein
LGTSVRRTRLPTIGHNSAVRRVLQGLASRRVLLASPRKFRHSGAGRPLGAAWERHG